MKSLFKVLSIAGAVSSGLAMAATIPQAGDNPLVVDQTATTDNITFLMAAAAERPNTIGLKQLGSSAKHGWLKFFDDTSKSLKWNLQLAQGKKYQVTALMKPVSEHQKFELKVHNGQSLHFTVEEKGWQRVNAGFVYLPAGVQTLELKRTTANGDVEIKSLELIAEDDLQSYQHRVDEFKSKNQKFNQYDFGIMFQYGGWTYPQSGPAKSLDQQAADTDVDALVDMIKESGADYVIWSTSWATYEINAPLSSVDNIVGHSNRTSSRDLLFEVANALEEADIDLYFYYHVGHSRYNGHDWWDAQEWPSTYVYTGLGDRSTFFNNWESVISEMSQRYGRLLDGWFFDDGLAYYPAPFERLGKAAKLGNPDRIVSYNSWQVAHYTDFEDISFGEECKDAGAEVGSNGLYTSEGDAGLQGQCMYRLENDWGIYRENQPIGPTRLGLKSATNMVLDRASRGVPTSFNVMMYEDGSIAQDSLDLMSRLRSALDSQQSPAINDDNSNIKKVGNWGRSTNRGVGDFNDDVSYTRTNGDYYEYSFFGSGITISGPMRSDMGEIEIFIDGVSKGVVNTQGSNTAQDVYFSVDNLSASAHTVKVVKKSGNFMVLDKIEVSSKEVKHNDNSGYIKKNGSWGYGNRRGIGEYGDDISYTTRNGDSIEFTFTGTEVTFIGQSFKDQGDIEIFINNESQGIVSTYSTDRITQKEVFKIENLPLGVHTLKAVKRSGRFMVVDAISFQ
ncbi:hypothetical protein [Pseudoalteromonas phenolica]|uniref:Uncharacterized protein n=1 Tax=Pseudoalteromonas phenolica TaxID=161398 RepID=A0A0S2K3J1_9GAMM|nr:hypothetical protein [Pseudoalteromonas phenolica]ALO42865.1 hypothetical protein PP2015_2372 [Pseudoalteromonas phenolica]MBE0356000.1 hypothetical protein [Pseudoalteromonas phenolica O-BC30]RXE94668.1 hypothetical protein D9981_18380 [Pseudoalteromonas phenolica O-BC30]